MKLPRRHLLHAGGAAAVSGMAGFLGLARSARADPGERSPTFDPYQRFLRLVPGGNGVIYAVQADGALRWYRHLDPENGTPQWANGAGVTIADSGWNQYETVLGGADGQLLCVRGNGEVVWHRYLLSEPQTGAGSWHPGSGSVIGTGFQRFSRVFGGWDGVIHGITESGELLWYRYLAGDGSSGPAAWSNGGTGSRIASGFRPYTRLWAAPSGVIYGAKQGGTLDWWRYLAGDGSTGGSAWAGGGDPINVGSGWSEYAQCEWLSNELGTIYTVRLDGSAVPAKDDKLTWYRLTTWETVDRDGARWANAGTVIGDGFTIEPDAVLQGYPSAFAVSQAGTASFAVSSTLSEYRAGVVRLAPAEGDPVPVRDPQSRPGRLQPLPSDFRTDGCGWTNEVEVTVDPGWRSGIYALSLHGPHGLTRYVPFVVRPAAPRADLALILPTNTYNAYNIWGGHNQYSAGGEGHRRTVTFQRPNSCTAARPRATIDHTLFSDLMLTRWMTASGYEFDTYHDEDLHRDGRWLSRYKAVVLASHPEYWSESMWQHMSDYLDTGGRLVYTGGNGCYERCEFVDSGKALRFRTADGRRDLFRDTDKPEYKLLGVEWNPAAYMNFAPYRVVTPHPLLDGTGLSEGDHFGESAYNGAASGLEVDIRPATPLPDTTLIAKGTNAGGGAEMVFVDRGDDGWVFSAGSISFNGALPYSDAIPRILGNVMDLAVS